MVKYKLVCHQLLYIILNQLSKNVATNVKTVIVEYTKVFLISLCLQLENFTRILNRNIVQSLLRPDYFIVEKLDLREFKTIIKGLNTCTAYHKILNTYKYNL